MAEGLDCVGRIRLELPTPLPWSLYFTLASPPTPPQATGYTYFLPKEETLESRIVTRE